MNYSNPIKAIFEREYTKIQDRKFDGATRLLGEISTMQSAVSALEGIALNRSPADNDAVHQKKTHEAGVKLAKAVDQAKARANELLNRHITILNKVLEDRTGLEPAKQLDVLLRHQELRQVVRGMDDQGRRALLNEAVKNKDASTLNALFNGGPTLTGIDPKFMTQMRGTYELAVAGEVLEELDALITTDGALQAVIRTCTKASTDAQDPAALDAFIKAQQAADSASASFDAALNTPHSG